jgi:hypothetical protein
MKNGRFRFFAVCASSVVVLVSLCPFQRLHAQIGVATLSGSVTDPSGAFVPNAQVTLQSSTEKASRQVTTDSAGGYFIAAIVPGTYELVVTAPGFDTRTITGITLSSGQGSTLNVTLSVGKAVTNVTVNEVAPLLETTTATVGAMVNSREFVALPMLGRNFTTLIDVLPGVVNIPSTDATYATSGVQGAAIAPAIYGQRPRDTYYSLDGADNVEPNFNTIGILPPPEAIAEMKVESGMATGAYGWASGANVNIVTKSGTREFHGDAWEFIRNDALNARSYFSPVVAPYKWNQFGGTLGGPLVIPHLISKEKAWYVFGWYEGVRVHQLGSTTALVPTAAELNGDFSADPPIYNPFTTVVDSEGNIVSRQQFPGNQIPTGTTDVCAPQPACINPTALALAKAFYPLPNLAPGVIPGVNFFKSTRSTETSDMWSARVDHQFGPKDNMYARFTDWNDPTQGSALTVFTSQGHLRHQSLVGSETHLFDPNFLVTARFSMFRETQSNTAGGPDLAKQLNITSVFPSWHGFDWIPTYYVPGSPGIGTFYGVEGPQYAVTWTADFQKIKGRHALAFGGGFTRTTFNTGHTTGEEDFGSAQTAGVGGIGGSGLGSFLLGVPYAASRVGGTWLATLLYHSWNWYVQDTFRVTPKWTLNLGLRWDYISKPNVTPGLATFDYTTGKYYFDHKSPIDGSPPNAPIGLVPPDYNGYQPRVGLAYQITPKTVFRSSFGIFDDLYGANQQGPTGSTGNWPYTFPQSLSGLNTELPTVFIDNPFPGPPVGSTVPLACIQCENMEKSTTRNSYVEEWSASLERQVTPSTMFEVDYFGSHGVKLWGSIMDNTAWPPGTGDYTLRQKYPEFAVIDNNDYGGFMSWYDGLSMKLEKRYSQGLSFRVSYTWSHAIDQADSLWSGNTWYVSTNGGIWTIPTRFDIDKHKASAGFDMRQVFSFSYVYNIPGKTSSRLLNGIVSNWQISGIVSADSGVPYYVPLSIDNENIGASYTQFPDFLCNPDNVKRTATQWFNTSCFGLPAYGTVGSGDRHAYYSDPLLNWDQSIMKQWPFHENKRVEFRAEFFNLPNSSTFNPPWSLFGTPGFGTVSTTRQGGRNIQFALKFHF